jgi:hypothetical protein
LSEHPFQRFASTHHERAEAQADTQYENTCVDYLIKGMHLHANVRRELYRQERDETTHERLTFHSFHERFPTFPFLLGCSRLRGVKLHLDKKAMIPSLFRQFNEAPFVAAYEQFYESMVARANGRSLGMVFPRKGIVRGLIIYSGDFDLDIPHSLLWTYTGGTKKSLHRLYVRPFQQVVEAIHNKGAGWRPE